ncbi:MAG: aminodeoxychorismate synthase component I [Phycisphaerales bacterium]|nr:aminodeoxychorismate synthase component I [Phycisphaerales bacterium]
MSAASFARLLYEPLDAAARLEAVISRLSPARRPVVFDCGDPATGGGRFTVIGVDPLERFILNPRDPGCPFRSLEAAIRRWPRVERLCGDSSNAAGGGPFSGGWVGFFTYESGLRTENVRASRAEELRVPLMEFGLYDHALVYDADARRWHASAVVWPAGITRGPRSPRERIDSLKEILAGAGAGDPRGDPAPVGARPLRFPPEGGELIARRDGDDLIARRGAADWSAGGDVSSRTCSPCLSRAEYTSKVERIREYIAAGDVYQVNLTQRFDATTRLSPVELHLRLREVNPAPHAALILREEYAILSASPELFLDIEDRRIVTRPIKGTRPRIGRADADAQARRELAASEKDRAELVMIVDLLRNDLGRVCEHGSVRVVDDGVIEEHPTVFHRVATIEGRLRESAGLADVLRATCPGGSITGAPKIRAMQIIDELEPAPRGAYCGSIGFIGLDGRVRLNLAIRTMTQIWSTVHVHAGGGIVADSTADAEFEETLAKARGMFQALGVTHAPSE